MLAPAAAAELVDLDPDFLLRLQSPTRTLEVSIPVRMDDGSLEVFTGWRIHHDTTRGPGKGGIRFHPDVDVREVAALADACRRHIVRRPRRTRHGSG